MNHTPQEVENNIRREFGRLQREHNLVTWDWQIDFILKVLSTERTKGKKEGYSRGFEHGWDDGAEFERQSSSQSL